MTHRLLVRILYINILIQRTTKNSIYNLHSSTDTQDRQLIFYCRLYQSYIVSVAEFVGGTVFGYRLFVVIARVHIATSTEKYTIEPADDSFDCGKVVCNGDYYRYTADSYDRFIIVFCQFGIIIAVVCRDTDKRFYIHFILFLEKTVCKAQKYNIFPRQSIYNSENYELRTKWI